MSMPNIPDINPEINITFDDAVNLLLKSIADEEISMAKLMDAEKNQILYVLNKYKNNEAEIGDVLAVNKSVDETVINLTKLQMLLDFKLQSVKKLMPEPKPCPPVPPPCPEPCKCREFRHCLIGKIKGEVSNKSDEFYCAKAVLDAFISPYNYKNNIIGYYAEKDCASLYLTACPNNIKIECPCESKIKPEKIKLWGKAKLTQTVKYKNFTNTNVSFELIIWDNKPDKNGFQIIIKSDGDKSIIHDSGFVKQNSCGKGLIFFRC